jgi:hypothetical protein
MCSTALKRKGNNMKNTEAESSKQPNGVQNTLSIAELKSAIKQTEKEIFFLLHKLENKYEVGIEGVELEYRHLLVSPVPRLLSVKIKSSI